MSETQWVTLCNQFNCTKDELYDILGRYQVVVSQCWAIASGIILIFCIILLIFCIKQSKKDIFEVEIIAILWFLSILGTIIFTVAFLFNLIHYLGFLESPNVAAWYYIQQNTQ